MDEFESGRQREHPILSVYDPGNGSGRHYDASGKRCLDHGHCGACDKPVVMDKLGRFAHIRKERGTA